MDRFIVLVACGVVALAAGGVARADDKKTGPKYEERIINGPKADVVVKGSDKAASAKPGQTVQIGIGLPLIPPFPSDIAVTVDGMKVDAKVYDGAVHLDGRSTPSAKVKLVQFKVDGEGKKKVVLVYNQGLQKYPREIELNVMK